MNKKHIFIDDYVIDIITSIRESFGGSVAVYTYGGCYQFYEIIKAIIPEAEAFYDGNHVWTKINGKFYDIIGLKEISPTVLIPVDTEELILALTKNKWSDERRKEYNSEYKKLYETDEMVNKK